jgi:hypothetical protein
MGTLEGIVGILRVLKPLIWALAILWVAKTAIQLYDERFNTSSPFRIKALPLSYFDVSRLSNGVLPDQDPHALALIRARGR